MRPTPLALAVGAVLALFASASALEAPVEALVQSKGAALELRVEAGGIVFSRFVPAASESRPERLPPQAEAVVGAYLAKVPEAGQDAFHAASLSRYLKDAALARAAFEAGPEGARLTALGRNLLVDVLSARDGIAMKTGPAVRPEAGATLAGLKLEGFDWDAFAADGEALEQYAITRAQPTGVGTSSKVRVLVETPEDGLKFGYGAKIVNKVEGLTVVEVSADQAAALGKSLTSRGVRSRPSRVFRSPAMAQVPQKAASKPGPKSIGIMNAESRRILEVESMQEHGMSGKGALVGVIDTGIDLSHPDFKDRVVEYVDLMNENGNDVLGHGTHVAGSIAGSGEASGGLHRGMAPEAKLAVFKVFDKDGFTTEDVILEAMRRAGDLGVQVLNLSLGGPDDPESGPLSQLANRLVVEKNVLVVAAAGNSGPRGGSISSPGNAEYALSVTGVDKQGNFPSFSSRGPVATADGRRYAKPDLSAVAGGVDPFPQLADLPRDERAPVEGTLALDGGAGMTHCVYGPGVISARSKDDPETVCDVPGLPGYRLMSGTSMAAPMAAGIASAVAGWLNENGGRFDAIQVKAAMMETARDLGERPELQGAGLVNASRLSEAVRSRSERGLPVGNVAAMLAMRLTGEERRKLQLQDRYRMTELGLWDAQAGKLVNDDAAIHKIAADLDALTPPVIARVS